MLYDRGQEKTHPFSSTQLFYCAVSNSNREAKLTRKKEMKGREDTAAKQAAEKKGAKKRKEHER